MGVCSSLCEPNASYEPIDAQQRPPRPPPAGHSMRRGLGAYDSGSDSDDPEVRKRRKKEKRKAQHRAQKAVEREQRRLEEKRRTKIARPGDEAALLLPDVLSDSDDDGEGDPPPPPPPPPLSQAVRALGKRAPEATMAPVASTGRPMSGAWAEPGVPVSLDQLLLLPQVPHGSQNGTALAIANGHSEIHNHRVTESAASISESGSSHTSSKHKRAQPKSKKSKKTASKSSKGRKKSGDTKGLPAGGRSLLALVDADRAKSSNKSKRSSRSKRGGGSSSSSSISYPSSDDDTADPDKLFGDDGDDSDEASKGQVANGSKITPGENSSPKSQQQKKTMSALFGDDATVSFGSDEEDVRPSSGHLFGAKNEGAEQNDDSSDDEGSNMFG